MANTNTSDVTPNTYAYRSYIKDIFLEVPNYRYFHHPYEEGRKSIFIGRTKIKNTFLEILKESESNGVYLVTGYRGMGKTSFVNRVIEEYTKIEEDKHKIVKKIKISLFKSSKNI